MGAALKSFRDHSVDGLQYILSFVYDKGLDSYPQFLRNHIRVVLPDKKQKSQQIFKKDSSEKDTTVAKARNLIENINAELKQYHGFDRQLHLARIDMAAHEANVARFLVNLKPEYRAGDVTPASEEFAAVPVKDGALPHVFDKGDCNCIPCELFFKITHKVAFTAFSE